MQQPERRPFSVPGETVPVRSLEDASIHIERITGVRRDEIIERIDTHGYAGGQISVVDVTHLQTEGAWAFSIMENRRGLDVEIGSVIIVEDVTIDNNGIHLAQSLTEAYELAHTREVVEKRAIQELSADQVRKGDEVIIFTLNPAGEFTFEVIKKENGSVSMRRVNALFPEVEIYKDRELRVNGLFPVPGSMDDAQITRIKIASAPFAEQKKENHAAQLSSEYSAVSHELLVATHPEHAHNLEREELEEIASQSDVPVGSIIEIMTEAGPSIIEVTGFNTNGEIWGRIIYKAEGNRVASQDIAFRLPVRTEECFSYRPAASGIQMRDPFPIIALARIQ